MGGFSLWHWLIVLVIVVLVFGTKRLKQRRPGPRRSGQGLQEGHAGRRQIVRAAQLPDESRNGQQQTKADSTQRNDEQRALIAARSASAVVRCHVRYRLLRAAGHRDGGPARARPRAPAEGRALRRPVGAPRARAVVFGEVRARARARRRRAQAQPARDRRTPCARCRTTCSAAANRCGASSNRWAATCSPKCPRTPRLIMPL